MSEPLDSHPVFAAECLGCKKVDHQCFEQNRPWPKAHAGGFRIIGLTLGELKLRMVGAGKERCTCPQLVIRGRRAIKAYRKTVLAPELPQPATKP